MNRLLTLWFLCLNISVFAQIPMPDIEKLINLDDLPEDNEHASEEINSGLLELLSNPVNLNEITFDFFSTVSFLNHDQVEHFFNYRDQSGGFQSIYELQVIPEWDLKTCKLMALISYVPETHDKGYEATHIELLVRHEENLQKKKGFTTENGFEGRRAKESIRIKATSQGRYSMALAVEKDPGEKFQWDFPGKIGFDQLSGNLTLYNLGIIKKLILGDYRVQFGQGIMNGSAFGTGKGSETINGIHQPNSGIRPSSSFAEFGFFRGAAFTIQKNNFTWSTYGSIRNEDATIRTDSLRNNHYITTFQQTGLHRTAGENSSRKTVQEKIWGTMVGYQSKFLSLGAQIKMDHFSIPIGSNPEPYKTFSFRGQKNISGGFFINTSWENIYLFNESAITKGKAIGSVLGTILSITKDLDVSILARYFDRGFTSFSSKTFAESSNANNEDGLYWGLKWKPLKMLVISAYYDFFKFPWLKFQVNNPSMGHESLIRLDILNKKIPSFITFKSTYKQQSVPVGSLDQYDLRKRKIRLAARSKAHINDRLSATFQVAYSFYQEDLNEEGILFMQDLKYEGKSITLGGGYYLFDSDSFYSGFYVNEPDVRYKTSLVSLSDKGIRYFINLKSRLTRRFTLWLKYDLTSYLNKTEIGSGMDTIEGNKKSEIRTQIIYSLN